MATLKWLTPDVIPGDTIERKLCIPNDPQIIAAISGALLPLTYPENWEQYGSVTPAAIAVAMSDVFVSFLGETGKCMDSQRTPILLSDQKAQATQGGTATSGAWQKRTLNVIADLENIGASLSNSEFTLPAGRWLIKWRCPAYQVGRHQSRLWSVDEADDIAYGNSQQSNVNQPENTWSEGVAFQTNNNPTTYRIEHRVFSTVATFGFGVDSNFGTEVYTQVECIPIL